MIECDFFEDHYKAWKNNELSEQDNHKMHSHESSCEMCASYGDVAELKQLIAEFPMFAPEEGFEQRLQHRIDDIKFGRTTYRPPSRGFIPKWASISAGIATGVAIGFAFLIPMNQTDESGPSFVSQGNQSVLVQQEIKRDKAPADTIVDSAETESNSQYDPDLHSRTVSTSP